MKCYNCKTMDRTAYIPVKHDDDYYTHDTPLFVGNFPYYRHEERMVQGKAYFSEERYSWGYEEIIPLSERTGGKFAEGLTNFALKGETFH